MNSDEEEQPQGDGPHFDVELTVDVDNHLKDALKGGGAPEIVDKYMPVEDRRGPWDDEPDHHRWTTEQGYDANVLRGGVWKGLCGYITVPLVHGVSGITYFSEIIYELNVHGGITLTDQVRVNEAGEFEWSDRFWTFGFDASHFLDLTPRLPIAMWDSIAQIGGEYRDMEYMVAQTNSLSVQLYDLQHHRPVGGLEH